jgi:hypothetical protein
MGNLSFRLFFAFMRDILSSLIGHVARYAFVCKGTEVLSSAQRRLSLSFPLAAGALQLTTCHCLKFKNQHERINRTHLRFDNVLWQSDDALICRSENHDKGNNFYSINNGKWKIF